MRYLILMSASLALAAAAVAQPPAPPSPQVPRVPPPAMQRPQPSLSTHQMEAIRQEAQRKTGQQSGPQLDQELNRQAQQRGFANWNALMSQVK